MVVDNFHQNLPSLARHGISFSFHNLYPQMGEDLKLIGLRFNLLSLNKKTWDFILILQFVSSNGERS